MADSEAGHVWGGMDKHSTVLSAAPGERRKKKNLEKIVNWRRRWKSQWTRKTRFRGNKLSFGLISWHVRLPLIETSINRKEINNPIIVIILFQFTALDWSAGDERELLMRANMSGRDFCDVLLSIFLRHISAYMWESKKGDPSSGACDEGRVERALAHAKC